jgi:putative glutamine amidotransferase
MKPLIGITSGHVQNSHHPKGPCTYAQSHTYADAVSQEGGIPVILPITHNLDEVKDIFGRLDGILFAGGNDVAPGLYGAETTYAHDVDVERDTHEVNLMKLALESHKPILAICRGMQLLNVVRGGTLYQDIVNEIPGAKNHDGYIKDEPNHVVHDLKIISGTVLSKILKHNHIHANSFHHQSVRDIAEGMTINAQAEDGIIEGMEDMRQGYIMAVQPHPESLAIHNYPEWRPLFQSFVEAAAKTPKM